jgi:CubicO group peptidase (beta-lactamase class C family)
MAYVKLNKLGHFQTHRSTPMFKMLMVLLWFGAVFSPLAHAQSQDPSARLSAIVKSYAQRHLFTGTALVARDNDVLLTQGVGLANREWAVPNAPEARFLIASVSKQFTAAALLRLVDQGKLKLDEPMARHLPADLVPPPSWRSITARHLLSHTSGIANLSLEDDLRQARFVQHSPKDLYLAFRDRPLDFEPGSQARYSNSGYIVAGLLIEALGGMPFADFLEREFFAPLSMKDTGVAHSGVITPRLASGYVMAGQQWQPSVFLNMSLPYSAGALYSSVGDLHRWQQALHGGRLLSAASYQAMTTPVKQHFALGLMRGGTQDQPVWTHSGGIPGFSTFMQYETAARLSVIVLGNFETARSHDLTRKLSAAAKGQRVMLPEESKPVALSADETARLIGAYRAPGSNGVEQVLWVQQQQDGLWARMGASAWTPLVPQVGGTFYAPGPDGELRFVLEPGGQASAVIALDAPDTRPWPRANLALPTLATQPVYLRGSMNNWQASLALQPDAQQQFKVQLNLDPAVDRLTSLAKPHECRSQRPRWRSPIG